MYAVRWFLLVEQLLFELGRDLGVALLDLVSQLQLDRLLALNFSHVLAHSLRSLGHAFLEDRVFNFAQVTLIADVAARAQVSQVFEPSQ